MKRSLLLLILLFFLGMAGRHPGARGCLEPGYRLWVHYYPDCRDEVRLVLQQFGAVFHYDFSDLYSFVVSLPEEVTQKIKHHPGVQELWYTQLKVCSQSFTEPVLQ